MSIRSSKSITAGDRSSGWFRMARQIAEKYLPSPSSSPSAAFMNIDSLVSAMRQLYPCREPRELGLGKRPALLVVDFIEGFTNARSPLGGQWDEQIGFTAALLALARLKCVPVVFTTVEYDAADLSTNLLAQKTPGIGILVKGSEWTDIDHRLDPEARDLVISKK